MNRPRHPQDSGLPDSAPLRSSRPAVEPEPKLPPATNPPPVTTATNDVRLRKARILIQSENYPPRHALHHVARVLASSLTRPPL